MFFLQHFLKLVEAELAITVSVQLCHQRADLLPAELLGQLGKVLGGDVSLEKMMGGMIKDFMQRTFLFLSRALNANSALVMMSV